MLKNGVRLAFGTDYSVEVISPFRGLYGSVTREIPGIRRAFGLCRLAATRGAACTTLLRPLISLDIWALRRRNGSAARLVLTVTVDLDSLHLKFISGSK